MLNKKIFLFFFLSFSSFLPHLHAFDIDQLPLAEDATHRRFRVRALEGRALTHPAHTDREQHALRGKTFLNYNVSAGQFACLFHAVQKPRQSLIPALIEAAQKDDEQGIKIRAILRIPTLENLGRAQDALNPLIQVTKLQVCDFLRPFSQNGVFTPYEVALAHGVLHRKKVFVWQHQAHKEVALLGCNTDNYPEHLHIGYYPGHFQRLVLEDAPDLAFNKAKSLLIERRVGTPFSSFLTENELARLRMRLTPKPQAQIPLLPMSGLQFIKKPMVSNNLFQSKASPRTAPKPMMISSYPLAPSKPTVFASLAQAKKHAPIPTPTVRSLPTTPFSVNLPRKAPMNGGLFMNRTPLVSRKPLMPGGFFMNRAAPVNRGWFMNRDLFMSKTSSFKGPFLMNRASYFDKMFPMGRTLPMRSTTPAMRFSLKPNLTSRLFYR